MNKEFFVSSTPHETKVGVVEDDQLAEIYLERENEYTLAGSIYKGRVTRVLPGMSRTCSQGCICASVSRTLPFSLLIASGSRLWGVGSFACKWSLKSFW